MTTTNRNALVVIVVACLLGTAFGGSFTVALDRPRPSQVPAGIVVGPSTHQAAAEIEARTQDGLAFRPYPTPAAVKRAIDQQEIYAGLVPFDGGAQLLVASAAGSSLADILRRAAGTEIPVLDLRPLPESDASGLLPFYLVLAATVTGFVAVLQLHTHAPQLSLRGLLLSISSLAMGAGGMFGIVTGPLLGSQQGALPEVCATVAGMIVVAALWCSAMQGFFGPWKFIPTFGFLMVLGIPSSGGAVAPPLLPRGYRFLAQVLPTGAAIETIRGALYFPDAQRVESILVLIAWSLGNLALLLIARRQSWATRR
jgi:hypothetical protein